VSRLGDHENQIISRLATATLGGGPLFAVVRGFTGGDRPALHEALRRERMPAAYAAFTGELTSQSAALEARGPNFSVFVAARALRTTSNPRHGDAGNTGAFVLIDQVGALLDGYEPLPGTRFEKLGIKFIEADERTAIYRLSYRVEPPLAVAPGAPQNLAETPSGVPGMMKFAWQAPAVSGSAGPAEFYRLYKKGPGDASFKLFETAAKDPTSKLLSAQAIGQLVGYYVTAVNVAGEGPGSNILWLET
jgi:hypothetical protein